ncbi:MAG: DUF3795 domain-containing protein [Oscillospiraceae bacterium]
MNREKGIAYCGLACCVCAENETCAGCRNDGCKDKDWCKNYRCCKEKKINGCWECSNFPCGGSMLDKMRICAFAEFIKEYGETELMDCLDRNEKSGLVYHYKNELVGDYDKPQSKIKIRTLIKQGS